MNSEYRTLHQQFVAEHAKAAGVKNVDGIASSPSFLLQLPLELRLKIWKLVIGDQVIHLVMNTQYELSHEVCHLGGFKNLNFGTTTEEGEAMMNESILDLSSPLNNDSIIDMKDPDSSDPDSSDSDSSDSDSSTSDIVDKAPVDNSWENFHWPCAGFGKPFSYLGPSVDTSLLQVSRRVNAESFVALWGTNQFTCSDPSVLKLFLSKLNKSQKRQLRNLQLTLNGCCNGVWTRLVKARHLKQLTRFRSLHVCFAEAWLINKDQDLPFLRNLGSIDVEHLGVSIHLREGRHLLRWKISTQEDKEKIEEDLLMFLLDKRGLTDFEVEYPDHSVNLLVIDP